MAMTAETFNSMAFSIASMASAFATGNFKSRSPSWEVRASDELEIKKRAYACRGGAGGFPPVGASFNNLVKTSLSRRHVGK